MPAIRPALVALLVTCVACLFGCGDDKPITPVPTDAGADVTAPADAGPGDAAADPQHDARLQSLAMSTGVLTPTFSPDTVLYQVAASVLGTPLADTATVTPTAMAPGAKILVNGTALASGATSGAIDITSDVTLINVRVTAPDGVTFKDYAIITLRSTELANITYAKASNPGSNHFFGGSVAISGDTLVVGAYSEDSNATGVNGNQADHSAPGAGSAYVFVRKAGVWSQQAYLKASNAEAGDHFGVRVAIAGVTIVVGAPGEDSSATGVNGNQADNV